MESVVGIAVEDEGDVVEVTPAVRAACSVAGGYVTGLVASTAALLVARELVVSDESVSVEDFNLPVEESFE